MGVELKDGSAEYWEYKEMAEDIYRDFCAANDTDAKRRPKQRGDRLKSTLISEYGRGDSNVRYIIDTYLDLRV